MDRRWAEKHSRLEAGEPAAQERSSEGINNK